MDMQLRKRRNTMNDKFFMYKGYPLVRKGNELYYGYMSDPFVIWIQIIDTNDDKSTKKVRVVQMATKVDDPKISASELKYGDIFNRSFSIRPTPKRDGVPPPIYTVFIFLPDISSELLSKSSIRAFK